MQFTQLCHIQASKMWDRLNCSMVGMELMEKPSARSDLKKIFLITFCDHCKQQTQESVWLSSLFKMFVNFNCETLYWETLSVTSS